MGGHPQNGFTLEFSLPLFGDQIRGYVSCEGSAVWSDWRQHTDFVQVTYVCQKHWLSYPWTSPIRYLRESSWSSHPIYEYTYFLSNFVLD